MAAELRENTGEVVLPIDRLAPSFLENDLIAKAMAFRMAQCLAEHGVDFTPSGPLTDPVYFSEQFYGPWTRAQAEQFGFVLPMSPADLVANQIEGATDVATASPPSENATLSDEDLELAAKCEQTPAVQAFITPQIIHGAWTAGIDKAHTQVFDIDDARQALDDLHDCFATEGLTPDSTEPWLPATASARSLTLEQRELAQTVVSCKEQTDFTARVAAVEAALQAIVIDEYADELFEYRTTLDHALIEARTMFKNEGIPFIA